MTHYGIDVSSHQGTIDWRRVANSGKTFALIKCSEGLTYRDPRFQYNWNEAQAAGLRVGAYHFWRPGINQDQQAQNFRQAVGALSPDHIIPWLDVEVRNPHVTIDWEASWDQTREELTAFLPAIDSLFGCRVGIYTGAWFWNSLRMGVMQRPLWVATWNRPPGVYICPNGWDTYAIHQYMVGDEGTVPGIGSRIDLDYMPSAFEDVLVSKHALAETSVLDEIRKIRASLDIIERLAGVA